MNKFHGAKLLPFKKSHNRLFMAFVIPHSWYFVVTAYIVRPFGLKV
jgi:hypothetical protein